MGNKLGGDANSRESESSFEIFKFRELLHCLYKCAVLPSLKA